MYSTIYETSCQSRFDARYWMLGLVHWDDPEGWYRERGGRRVQDGEYMYTCGRFILSTILDAWGWCTGMTQRDGMGRKEGGGFGMGNTCIPVADSF